MGIEHLTIVTCDRCKSEFRYDSCRDRDWYTDWASLWPARIASYGGRPAMSAAEVIVCADCLTDVERGQLAESRVRLQVEAEIPF
jgi:hypothetical protein